MSTILSCNRTQKTQATPWSARKWRLWSMVLSAKMLLSLISLWPTQSRLTSVQSCYALELIWPRSGHKIFMTTLRCTLWTSIVSSSPKYRQFRKSSARLTISTSSTWKSRCRSVWRRITRLEARKSKTGLSTEVFNASTNLSLSFWSTKTRGMPSMRNRCPVTSRRKTWTD